MIVLDEHLPVPELGDAISRWYRGRVCIITDLRLGSVIKDEAVPTLLQSVREPTFLTLDWVDFWRRTVANRAFCVVCFNLPSERADEISSLLRRLLRLEEFKTKAARMGTVVRVSTDQVAYYQVHDAHLYVRPLP